MERPGCIIKGLLKVGGAEGLCGLKGLGRQGREGGLGEESGLGKMGGPRRFCELREVNGLSYLFLDVRNFVGLDPSTDKLTDLSVV